MTDGPSSSCETPRISMMVQEGWSEGCPNGIFHPCAPWTRAFARWWSCGCVAVVAVAVAVTWIFRSTLRPGNYIWSYSYVLGSWWEIFENGDRGSAQNFDTNLMSIVVWPGEPFSKNVCFGLISKITMFIFPGTRSQNVFSQMCQPERSMETHSNT